MDKDNNILVFDKTITQYEALQTQMLSIAAYFANSYQSQAAKDGARIKSNV